MPVYVTDHLLQLFSQHTPFFFIQALPDFHLLPLKGNGKPSRVPGDW